MSVAEVVIGILLASVHPADLTQQQEIRTAFSALLQDADDGRSRYEQAAFVVRLPSGHIALVRWPRSESADEARWSGPFPSGTVAIAHTHPNWMPRPSRIDAATARSARLPVYVITQSHITRTDGREVERIADAGWDRPQA